jgi:ribosomal protein S18 acetylase RimI-like enzyme
MVKLLATVDLGPEIEGMAGRQLRMRRVTIEPGGVFGPIHDHEDRPGTGCIRQGATLDHRNGVATDHGLRAGWPDDRNTTHWLENGGPIPAVEISVDIIRQRQVRARHLAPSGLARGSTGRASVGFASSRAPVATTLHGVTTSAMEFARPHIRTATLADAEPLAALAERTFRDTFADDNATDDMDAYVRDAFSLDRVRAELADAVNTFLLAFIDGVAQPQGYAKLRNGTTDPSVTGPDPVELQRLYVDRSAMGQGLGAALMRASLDTARSAGRRTLWLGVWERNARAISFYERWQFETVGEHVFRLGSDEQKDLIMARPAPGAV